MGSINKQPKRFEITAVYRHPDAKADIVLVHGLNGNPQKTWTAPNDVYWPTDLLPASLRDEHANVLVYGYNADVFSHHWGSSPQQTPSDNYVFQHAQTLVATLTQYRKSEGTERNPIIWVVHSLGGIVTKSALLYSNDVQGPHQEDLRSIYVSTFAIIFLGTPHNGSNAAAWGRILQRMADAVVPRKLFVTEAVLLKTLKKDSESLQQISNHFLDIYQRFQIQMVHENHKTDVKGSKILIVDSSSAGPALPNVRYYSIEATHSGMCKFESEDSPGYLNISTAIREWVAKAPEVVPSRWEAEDLERRIRAAAENREPKAIYESPLGTAAEQQGTAEANNGISSPPAALPKPSHTTSPPLLTECGHSDDKQLVPLRQKPSTNDEHEPLFIHPEPFRPNSYFVGREDELRGLHEMLMDRRRRSEGTSAVLIRCLPGGGKTHLARQYVFKHKEDYPGGVYWVRAKSRHELEYWFWRIAKNEALRGLVDQRDVEELRNPKKIVQIVRRWLNSQSDWLVVFDGVQFDTPGLLEFIPDARNTSLIYTSTERAVTGDPRFDNPQVMELGLLTAPQAQDLLLLEMERKRPWSAEDQAMALELVQLMGRLPLMIHVAAQHLKATREPLARYLKSYRSRPKAGGLPAYKAVREQLENRGETAALNLISLLVFFDQHLPVEMLALGLSALDNVTPVKTRDALHRKANLNNTLKVLIAFALLERSESDDISPSSSRSSKRSFDKQVDYLDLLRIHSVVQAFFIDSLHERHQIHFWLERAVAIWCRSYDEADRRIQEDPRVGLPDDYRRFCIHGEKLLQNLSRFERRYPSLAKARPQLEQRLEKIQGEIDHLSHAIQANIVDGSAEEHPASVFDRVSTSSQSDASATLHSESSQHSWEGFLGEGGNGELLQSPVAEAPEVEAPYPSSPVMPEGPEINDEDDQETVVSVAGTQIHAPASEIGDAAQEAQEPSYEDWQDVIPHHRVIRRQETRRYHDRGGAWRDKTVSDPRVGLSQEIAVGSISIRRNSSRSPLRARFTAHSEAELELNKIKLASPSSPRQPRGSFGSTTSARPKSLLGRNNSPQAQKTPDTEVAEIPPAESPSGLGQVLSSPKSWTAATLIKRLKQTVLPSSRETAPPPPTPPQLPAEEEEIVVAPGPIFCGSRSANSSPASHTSPFPPPSFSIPTEELMPQSGVPLVVRHWDTVVYHPDGTPITSSGVEWASAPDPMSLSYPSLPTRAHPPAAALPWLRSGPPAGYSSQPMSRDGSHGSSPRAANISPSPFVPSSTSSPLLVAPPARSSSPSPSPPDAAHSRPRPATTTTAAAAAATTPARPIPIPVPIPNPVAHIAATPSSSALLRPSPFPTLRHPPASYTVTEPSPRLDTPFADVDTSYRRWEEGQHQQHHQHHQQHHQQQQEQHRGTSVPVPVSVSAPTRVGGSGGGAAGGKGPSSSTTTGLRPPPRGRGAARARSILRGVGKAWRGQAAKRRSQSLSPSGRLLSPSGSGSPSSPPAGSGSGSEEVGSGEEEEAEESSSSRGRVAVVVGGPAGVGMAMGTGAGTGYQAHPQPHQHQHPLAEWSVLPAGAAAAAPDDDAYSDVDVDATAGGGGHGGIAAGRVAGGEAMSRSASGGSGGGAGIRVGEGMVVEFGSPGLSATLDGRRH